MYKDKARIDFERIKEITELTDVFLSLHGATGVTEKDMKEVIRLGVCKINIGAALRQAFTKGMTEATLQSKSVGSPENILAVAEQRMKEVVRLRMRVYGSSGEASWQRSKAEL